MTPIKILINLLFITLCCALITCFASSKVMANQGKLIATAGLMQAEGSGGGGIVPWASLSGYDTREQISISAGITQVNLRDYRLNTKGISASFYDKLELSLAQQRFDLTTLGGDITQDIIGLKYRLYGDVVYSKWPQISIGLQHKHLKDKAVAFALGAKDTNGTDFYLAATKVHLGLVGGYNAVWNIAIRATKANEMGLLGFGSATDASSDEYRAMLEASFGVLLSRHVVVGIEFRQKPDNLGLGESNWQDYFVSYLPSKSLSVTLAWAKLGTIAGASKQRGLYISFNGQLL